MAIPFDATKVKIMIHERGLNYGKFAERAGISANWTSTILDRGRASVPIIYKMAKALDIDPNTIIISEPIQARMTNQQARGANERK